MGISSEPAFVATVVIVLFACGRLLGAVNLVDATASGPAPAAAFPLVAGGAAAPIILPADAPEVVKIAARDLADDIATVTGAKPDVLNAKPGDASGPRVELVLAPGDLPGRWEAFRLSATPG